MIFSEFHGDVMFCVPVLVGSMLSLTTIIATADPICQHLSAEHLHRSCSNPLWQTTSAAGHPNVPHRQPTSLRFAQGPSKHGHEMKGSGWIKIVSGSLRNLWI